MTQAEPPFLTMTFADGRVVALSDIDAFNLGEGLVAAARFHLHPQVKAVFNALHERIAPPKFEIDPH